MGLNERSRPTGEQEPTPQELNARLSKICERLPYPPRTTDREELIGAYNAIKALIDYACYNLETITPSFESFLLARFQVAHTPTLNTSRSRQDLFLWVLDEENTESGGLFEPKRAKELERLGISKDTYTLFLGQFAATSILEMQNSPSIDEGVRSFLAPVLELNRRWKEQFRAKHQEEP